MRVAADRAVAASERPAPGRSSVIGALRWRAEHAADERCFTFVGDDGASEVELTYASLFRRAAAVAAELHRRGARGERVLLLYPPGEHYVVAVYACLMAGAVAVPAYPPRGNRLSARIEGIAADARPALVLTTEATLGALAGLHDAPMLATDVGFDETATLDETALVVEPDPQSLAVLQYTSGSTTRPRGVMVTHGNLRHNLHLIGHGFRMSEADRGALWLPSYHDMGLLGGVLVPPYHGFPVALMPPSAFLQRPIRWLETIARHEATIAGGPNFGYELCVARTTPEERARLDLSSWRVAFVGAEPVRAETLDRFAAAFADAGFRREAFYPCYGLAEATLIVSGGLAPGEPVVMRVDAAALAEHRLEAVSRDTAADDPGTRAIVGCGRAMPDTTIAIVDPETGRSRAPGEVGEIWVAGPSVAHGYWNRPEESARAFGARRTDAGDERYLRTGDLGALVDGELFVTGRIKDLLIVDGRNHYAQDVEWTVERCHAAVAGGAGAVFSVEVAGEERLVVVQEVKRSALRDLDGGAVIGAIRAAVAREHDLPTHAVVLVRPLGIPKTSSGKVQRHACRDAYVEGTLPTVATWQASASAVAAAPAGGASAAAGAAATATGIARWLVEHVAPALDTVPEAIDVEQPLAYHGLTSRQAVQLSAELEAWLGRSVPPTLVYDYPTIAALARHLGGEAEPAPQPGTRATTHGDGGEPVAIVGMACRFPGAPDVEAFWRLLTDGIDAIGAVPDERRVLWAPYERAAEEHGAAFPRWGGFLGRVDAFEPGAFGITPREAASMDPQQRLLLELAWEALEDAGQPREAMRGSRAGVFVGISSSDYSRLRPDDPARADPYAGTGNALSIAANRLSYVFDLRGPSLAVDTACSSSLVAVHLACQSLRRGECGVALAGGVNLLLAPEVTASFAQMGFLAPDGRCKAFDARADGYVRGEGAGVVVLKSLARALADGDRVYAVIRGSAVNSDGRSNGLTAPNRHAQEAVLREAYAAAGLAPARVQYVEAHGTGTSLGDPIELEALGRVLGEDRAPDRPCAVGSVKSNIGHLEAAAGMAGLIKTVLAVSRAELPASLHFTSPNPHIPFDRLPLRVQASRAAWSGDGAPRVAGVSSFGFGGTNAHVVVEQAPALATTRVARERPGRARLLPISAATPAALRNLAEAYVERLTGPGAEDEWADICFSASVRRSHHGERLAIVAPSAAGAAAALRAHLRGERSAGVTAGRADARHAPRVVFVFTGQGNQWWGMGRELIAGDAEVRGVLEECDAIVRRHAGWSLLEALERDERTSRLHETAVAQPALVALQVALAARWRRWGVTPDAVVGHSVGELAAAHVAGVLSLDEALRVAVLRGRIMQQAEGHGRMAAVDLPPAEIGAVLATLEDPPAIAAVNGPTQVVLAGGPAAVEGTVALLRERGARCHELPVTYAFHSAQMAPLARELADALGDVERRPATVPIVPTAEGWDDEASAFGAGYWPHQLRHAVRFADAIHRCIDEGGRSFVELGPHPVLSGAVTACLRERDVAGVAVGSLRRGASDDETLLAAAGALYASGRTPDWRAMHPDGGRVVTLPAIAWQRQRCWLDTERAIPRPLATPDAGRPVHPLLGARIAVAAAETYAWEGEVDRVRQAFLTDHRFQGGELVPGTAYFEMAVAAATEVFGPVALVLRNIEFRSPLFLPRDGARRVQTVVAATAPGAVSFRIHSRPATEPSDAPEPWTLHAVGEVVRDADGDDPAPVGAAERAAIEERCDERLTGSDYFAELLGRGFEYGPSFRGLAQLWRRAGESLGRLEVPAALAPELDAYHLHPALLDAGGQLVVATDGGSGRPFLPAGVERVRVRARRGRPVWGHATYRAPLGGGAQGFAGDVRLLDADGNVLVEAIGLRVRYVEEEGGANQRPAWERWLYEPRWERRAQVPPGLEDVAGAWLILADRSGVGERLAARLTARGARCILAVAGDEFATASEDRLRVRPDDAGDLRRLVDAGLALDGGRVRGVVHLWSLDAAPAASLEADALARAHRLGSGAVVALVQALVDSGRTEHCPLWLVTRGAQPVGAGQPVPAVAQAPLWGLGRSILQEHPALAGGLLDLDPDADTDAAAAHLARELGAADGETQVALRAGDRWVARLARWSPAEAVDAVALRADASYLITGGLGGLGIALANWMLDRGARRLVLLGRTALPPRAEWTSVAAGSRVAGAIAAVRALEARGASVHLASVDVSDAEGLDAFLDTFAREGWPPIRGVVHAAGVVQDEILLRVSPATLEAVFRAKVLGGWLLHQRFRDGALDFFLLFSSAAALLGSAGQGTYAAANAFLDALAHLRRAHGLTALAIDWGPWDDVGMAARAEVGGELARRGIGSIPPAQGLELLGRLMRTTVTQVGAIPIDWPTLGRAVPAAQVTPFFEHLRDERGPADEDAGGRSAERGEARAALRTAAAADRQAIAERLVREEVARVSRLDAASIDAHSPLDLLGIDSLMSIELKLRLERTFDVSIPVVRMLEVPTVAGLAALLLDATMEHATEEAAASAPIADASRESSTTPLVALRTTGAEPPLFLVHPGALDVQCYAELARHLGDERPCWVLQPPELENYRGVAASRSLDVSIESVATSCIEAMRAVQPRGPYHVGGWSLGGVVAFEIAQQLEAQGERVALLALLDAPSPSEGVAPTDWDDAALLAMFASYLGARHGQADVLPPDDGVIIALDERLRRLRDGALAARVLPSDVDVDHVRSLYEAYKDGLRMGTQLLWRYRPRAYSGRIAYFRAAEASRVLQEVFPDATAAWARLAAGPLELHDVPGSHYTLFLEPNARELAGQLRREL